MSAEPSALPYGATVREDGVEFRVWAPGSERVDVVLEAAGRNEARPLEPEGSGFFAGRVEGLGAGALYRFRLDGGDAFPDPASRYQPLGVHGPSQVVDPDAFEWEDEGWTGVEIDRLVIYELHVGTFTPEGTFRAAAERLGYLVELGVSAIEIMPIANFPGARNWGYDGVNLYAPATAYGGPDDFKHLVNAAHAHGLAVVLDVVYNHLGPEGNYLPAVTRGHYFTDRHQTPWGDGINYDGPGSGVVREFVVRNALHWLVEYHVDALRLDATHAIVDDSPRHILREMAERIHALPGRRRLLIAEDERNERLVVAAPERGGLGLDGVWADDLHHQLRRLAAQDSEGYFAAFSGTVADVVATLQKGWYYEGQSRPDAAGARGTPAEGIEPQRFVHCIQNHDQVGNRAFGERLHHQVPLPIYRALSTLLLFSPYTPLLWMGQEWGASSPFLYFTDHPEELGRLVTEGRREEFGHFAAFRDEALRETIPDPQAEETFERSRLVWHERERPPHAGVLRLYRDLLALRRNDPALRRTDRRLWSVHALEEAGLAFRREGGAGEPSLLLVVVFQGESALRPPFHAHLRAPGEAHWAPVLVSEDLHYGGSGSWGRLEGDGSMHLVGPVAIVLRST